MNYAKIKQYDVANGDGIRTTLFVSGCTHNCKGCFNKEQQSFTYGEKWTQEAEDIFIEYAKDPKITGVSILGGEPFQQSYFTLKKLLVRLQEEVKKPVWVWSGYTLEELLCSPYSKELLKYIDVLIDGRYEETKRNLSLKYRGSSNQKVIRLK